MPQDLCEVILIGGFLGAGKTTFLKRLLSWPGQMQGTVILVNEFGQVGIDGELLEGFATPVVELANGCICCTLQGDLIRNLEDILTRLHPQRLLVEATGVADTLDILKVFNLSQFSSRLARPKVVTIVDADYWVAREYFGPLFYNQIKAADLVLLNKIDLQDSEEVGRYMSEIRKVCPSCAIVPTYHCAIDPGVVWGLVEKPAFFVEDLARQDIFPLRHEHDDHCEKVGYVTFSFESPKPFREDCFRQVMAATPIELYRIKGYALVQDKRLFVNHVGGKTEWADSSEPGPTKLAFVGWKIDVQEIISRLNECLVDKAAG
jgi:G3E family GTPase